MSFVNELIKNIRKEYKDKQDNKTAIELMHITRAVRKGQVKCQKV